MTHTVQLCRYLVSYREYSMWNPFDSPTQSTMYGKKLKTGNKLGKLSNLKPFLVFERKQVIDHHKHSYSKKNPVTITLSKFY